MAVARTPRRARLGSVVDKSLGPRTRMAPVTALARVVALRLHFDASRVEYADSLEVDDGLRITTA